MTKSYRNFTLKECDDTLRQYVDAIRDGRVTFYQKFTCEKCWARITQDEPNKLFIIGHCQECGHFSDLQKSGCNYLLQLTNRRKPS